MTEDFFTNPLLQRFAFQMVMIGVMVAIAMRIVWFVMDLIASFINGALRQIEASSNLPAGQKHSSAGLPPQVGVADNYQQADTTNHT